MVFIYYCIYYTIYVIQFTYCTSYICLHAYLKLFFSLLETKKKDTLKIELELKTLKDKYNSSLDAWTKEKLEMQVNHKT